MTMTWCERVQARFKGVAFYVPQDSFNPAPGQYAVVGPTSETASSTHSIEHAAMLFLGNFHGDIEARQAAINFRP